MFKLLVILIVIVAVWGLPHSGRFPLQKSGRHIPGGRILGGQDTDIAHYPYQLAFDAAGLYTCGATLIGSKWALTNAFCTLHINSPSYVAVLAGSTDLGGGQLVNVTTIYRHPLFDSTTMVYDIAVLELQEDVTIESASPIALHDAGYWAEGGADATITGWGDPWMIGEPYPILQFVVTKIVSNEVCNESYGGRVTDKMACAGNWEEGGESPCLADWGGPLVVDGKLYGISSWSHGCGRRQWPFINTRVSEETLREFIRNITGI